MDGDGYVDEILKNFLIQNFVFFQPIRFSFRSVHIKTLLVPWVLNKTSYVRWVLHILCMGLKSFFWSGLNVFKNWCFKKFRKNFGEIFGGKLFLAILVTSKKIKLWTTKKNIIKLLKEQG